MIHPEEVQKVLAAAFPSGKVEVQDTTGTMDHFQVLIISPDFAGKTMVEQHQLVYRALGDLMKEAIHALALKTYTPEQWKNA